MVNTKLWQDIRHAQKQRWSVHYFKFNVRYLTKWWKPQWTDKKDKSEDRTYKQFYLLHRVEIALVCTTAHKRWKATESYVYWCNNKIINSNLTNAKVRQIFRKQEQMEDLMNIKWKNYLYIDFT